MRILVLTNLYPPYVEGGYELQCQAITAELIRRGHELCVLTSRPGFTRGHSVDGVHYLLHLRRTASSHPLHRHLQHLQWVLVSRSNYRIARRMMESTCPDIVYVWNMDRVCLSSLAAASDLGLRLVFDVGDYWLLQNYHALCTEPDRRKRAYRLFIHGVRSFDPRQFRHIHAVSSALKQQYVDAGFPAKHFSVVPWAMPVDLILETPRPRTIRPTIELLYAGRLTEAKGVHLAIQATALLNHELAAELNRPARLNVVGSGDPAYVRYLEGLARSLLSAESVHFLGRLSHQELLARYADHDAVLVPSVWPEPFGGVTVEAMAQGTCVIASQRGGLAEIITHGKDGILVPPEDADALARAVIVLVRDEEAAERIRHAAIRTVRERYVLDRVGAQVEAYLNAVVDENSSGRLQANGPCSS